MRHYLKFKDTIDSLINNSDNYIIFNDGKAIKYNINDDILISVDEIAERSIKRSDIEEDIIANSKFCVSVDFLSDVDLKLIYLNDEEKNITFFFNIKKNKNVRITNLYVDFECSTNTLVEYNVEEGAMLTVCDFASLNTNINEYVNYYLNEKSNLIVNNLKANDNFVNGKYNVYLCGKRAECVVNNSIINTCSNSQKYNFVIHHLEKNTKSELVGYGVSKNNSILNIDTNGIIKNGASKSEMFQKSKGIILDLDSTLSASPLLEIDEFDCMATHGASIGAIDESDLFYLMSRGLPREASENLIINGFFNPYLSKLNDENVLNYISNIIKKHLS